MKGYVAKQTQQRLSRVDAALSAVHAAPHDADALHDLRVATRRFQQCLRLFSGFFNRDRSKRIRRKLRRLMDRCGAVRNYDIALHLLQEASVVDGELEAALRAARDQKQERLKRHLRRWRGGHVPAKWSKWLNPSRTSQTPGEYARACLPGLITRLFAMGSKAAVSGDVHALHRFRLSGKRFRYTLEILEDAYETPLQPCLLQMRALQDRLGAMNDCVAARDLLSGFPPAQLRIDELLAERTLEFLAFWEQFRQQEAAWKEQLEGANHARDLHSAPRRRGEASRRISRRGSRAHSQGKT